MAGGGNRNSREAIVQARERERQVVQLYIRGLTWMEIARQLGLKGESGARMAFDRAVKRIPKADIELMRKLEGERITDLRRRLWSEFAGRPDPADPTKTIRPDLDQVNDLIDRAVRVGRHEAAIFGMDAPTKAQLVSTVIGQTLSDEELDRRLARFTPDEQQTFMRLLAKLNGTFVEPLDTSIETTASPVASDDHQIEAPKTS